MMVAGSFHSVSSSAVTSAWSTPNTSRSAGHTSPGVRWRAARAKPAYSSGNACRNSSPPRSRSSPHTRSSSGIGRRRRVASSLAMIAPLTEPIQWSRRSLAGTPPLCMAGRLRASTSDRTVFSPNNSTARSTLVMGDESAYTHELMTLSNCPQMAGSWASRPTISFTSQSGLLVARTICMATAGGVGSGPARRTRARASDRPAERPGGGATRVALLTGGVTVGIRVPNHATG